MRKLVEDTFRREFGHSHDLDRAVARNLDLGEGAKPLREHPFAWITRRELRRGGEIRKATQHDLGGCLRIGVRQAADASREPGEKHRRSEAGRHASPLSVQRIGPLGPSLAAAQERTAADRVSRSAVSDPCMGTCAAVARFMGSYYTDAHDARPKRPSAQQRETE